MSAEDFDKIRPLCTLRAFSKDELIFSDGDSADYIYFIESGHVYIFIEKFTRREEISTMGAGEYFGEMAFFSGDRRSASAAALLDSTLLLLDKQSFLTLFENDQALASKINRNLGLRSRDLTLKENLSAPGQSISLGIKGDPSLRETALTRERYDSVVDKIIPDLQVRLHDLLVQRTAYEIFIHCNSGEVHIRTVCNPFEDEIHPAAKLLNVAYIERHFPQMAYEEKASMIGRLHAFIGSDPVFSGLPDTFREDLHPHLHDWQPLGAHEIAGVLSRMIQLRKIPNFYLRNFSIGIMRDAIRMQFNCDGTQIVTARGYHDFIEDNVIEEEIDGKPEIDRRSQQRRDPVHQNSFRQGERRAPPGRRQGDWEAYLRAWDGAV